MNVTEDCKPHCDPVKPLKSQNVTTEERGRTSVLVHEINFVALLISGIKGLNCLTLDQFIRNSLLLRNREFVFEDLQPLN
jgi:hypothetical protein